MVEKLDVSFNRLQVVPSCALRLLPNLNLLLLNNNRIVHVPQLPPTRSYAFHVDLSYNYVTMASTSVFASFTSSHSIVVNLRHNRMTRASPEWLSLKVFVLFFFCFRI